MATPSLPALSADLVYSTGDIPWLHIIGSIDEHLERDLLYNSPIRDIDVFQMITVRSPADNYDLWFFYSSITPVAITIGLARCVSVQ